MTCLSAQAAPYTVVDDTKTSTTFNTPPQRVVSLLPSLAETVCALGACQRLVGVDRYTVWPPELSKLPSVGGGLDPHIEAIVALKPDVVLASSSTRASERLRALGLKVVVLEPKTHAQVKTVMGTLAQTLGMPQAKADKLWQEIQTGMDKSAAALPPALRGKRVYFEVSRGPYAAGETSFIGETITRVGLGNVVTKAQGPFPKLNPEFIVLKNPDFIMAGDRSATEMMLYPGWSRLPAVKAERFCLFTPEQIDILIHPGPRMGEGADLILRCVRGDLKAQSKRQPATGAKRGSAHFPSART